MPVSYWMIFEPVSPVRFAGVALVQLTDGAGGVGVGIQAVWTIHYISNRKKRVNQRAVFSISV